MRMQSAPSVEADLAALKLAAERAGTTLACLFASSAEYEADLIRVRRAQGAYEACPRRTGTVRTATLIASTVLLTFLFLML